MLNVTLLKSVLIVSIASSIISTTLVQRLKMAFKSTKYLLIYSFIISFSVGVAFSITFSDLSFIDSLWVGLISFIGADAIYQMFEDKIFSSLSSVITIERPELK